MPDEVIHEPVDPGEEAKPDEVIHEPVNPGAEAEPAEGRTNQPERNLTDEEQVATLQQTPNEDLAVDPDIEQPSQEPTDVVESDPGAEDEE